MPIFAILITTFLVLLSAGCHEAAPAGVVTGAHEPTHERTPNDVAVFNIEGPASYSNLPNFNRWDTLPKTKGRVHLFANDEKTLHGFSGVRHIVSRHQLASELSETLAKVNPERLIIFLSGHGAPTGNFCYESQASCHLTADVLVDALNNYTNKKAPYLQHVLVIPGSCYNKLLMDPFAELIKSKSFPFAITFISQKTDESCGTQSPAESLFENQIIPFHKLTDKQLEEYLNLTTVEQLVNFQNELITSHVPTFKLLEYQIRYSRSPSPTKLSEFGFDMRMWQQLYYSRPPHTKAFPNGISVKVLLDELKLPAHIQSKVQILQFQMVESKPDGGPNIRKINVDGNASLIINESDLQGKFVLTIGVILSQT